MSRDDKTMEQCARESRDGMIADLERLDRLREMAERAGDRFGLAEAADELEQEITDRNYGAELTVTIDVTLYGGGPAGGIEFDCDRGRWGLEFTSARQWHQDWFQPKGWVPLDDDVAQRLWDLWGLENMTLEDL